MRIGLGLDEKLSALQAVDPVRRWYSLDDRRVCILCDKPITGRMIEVRRDRAGAYQVQCPTPGCPSTPRDWFYRERSRHAPVKVFKSHAPVLHFGAAPGR